MNILIIEDTKSIAQTLADFVKESGNTVDTVYDGYNRLKRVRSNQYDAIVLDVMLPRINGFEILKTIRQENIKTPVLILTAKIDLQDRIQGLDSGADYYLTKPFEIEEFSACLRAITRRQTPFEDDNLRFGDVILSTALHELKCGTKAIKLRPKEYELLRLFIINKNRILPKETIINKVWGYDSEATDNNLEAYVSFLRRKLNLLSSNVTIYLARKVGYYIGEVKKDD